MANREEPKAKIKSRGFDRDKSVKMEFNVCEHCGARDGRAGNLISSQSLMNGAHLCMNCHDTAKSGNFVIHAYLERTDEELKKTSLLLQDQQPQHIDESRAVYSLFDIPVRLQDA